MGTRPAGVQMRRSALVKLLSFLFFKEIRNRDHLSLKQGEEGANTKQIVKSV